METYALLILFLAMVAIWLWSWAPWKKPDGKLSKPDQPPPPERKPRR